MARHIVAFLFIFAVLAAFDAGAGTTDVYVRGPSGIRGLNLQHRVAKCDACESLANAYNDTVDSMHDLEDWIEDIEEERAENKRADRRHHQQDAPKKTKEGMSDDDKKKASEEMNYRMMLDEMAEKIPEIEAQWEKLKKLAADLRAQLDACEAEKCNPQQEGGKKARIGNDAGGGGTAVPLPFDWRGPYPPVCHKCARLAERLNALPNMAREAMAKMERAQAEKMIAEMEIIEAQGEHAGFNKKSESDSDKTKNDKGTQQEIRDARKRKEQAEKDIRKAQQDLDAIKKNFEETLKLYNDCIPTCKEAEGKKVGALISPGQGTSQNCSYSSPGSIIIGPNSEYGTGAQMKNKAKGMATGMAMGALGNALGGKGLSFGGGGDDGIGSPGGGGSQKGPKTDKDPTRDFDYERTSAGGLDIGFRGLYDNGTLTVSSKIYDAPGDGTFHAQWLEDGQGKRYLPVQYLIFSLYQDWKLTVWWTYDRYVDGQHVEHDEGEEVTTGRNNLGDIAVRFEGEEGTENSIWKNLGFGTATKGVQALGAIYKIPPEVMGGVCPIQLITHVSQPKKDPVTTIPVLGDIPVLGQLFKNDADKKAARDLQVFITPHIIDAGEAE